MYVIFSVCTILFMDEVLHICGAPCARCTMCGCTKCAMPMPNMCRAEFVRCTLFSLKYMVCQEFLYATCALCQECDVVYHVYGKPCMGMGMCKGGVCVRCCTMCAVYHVFRVPLAVCSYVCNVPWYFKWRVPCLRCVT